MAIVPGNRYGINTRELDVNISILACPRNYQRRGKSGALVFHTIASVLRRGDAPSIEL